MLTFLKIYGIIYIVVEEIDRNAGVNPAALSKDFE